jgi:hypothetical protein
MNSFDTVWSSLSEKLTAGTVIKNWTAFRGYLGDTMIVAGVGENYIEVVPPKAENSQLVPRDDFQGVWEIWAEYKTQKVQRQEVREMTRFSKYIISILHWLETA